VVLIILLAVALSLGRGFIPSVARYKHVLEEQIYEATGLPVAVNSLSGSFQGFNPTIEISDLQLLVPDGGSLSSEQATAMGVANATIVLNIGQTIWQRRWVLEDFLINDLDIEFDQDSSGRWQLKGMRSGGQVNVDLSAIYSTLRRVSRLSLTNLSINLHTAAGNTSRLSNGTASIQNQGIDSFIHINANMDNNPEQLAFSVELQGREVEELTGLVHFELPTADYSSIFAGQQLAGIVIDGFSGGGDFWLSLQSGAFDQFTSSAQVDSFTFRLDQYDATTLTNLQGQASISRGEGPEDLQVSVEDFKFDWQGSSLLPFNAYLYFAPRQHLVARVDHIDVSFLSEFGVASGLLTGALRAELLGFAPRGDLENLNLFMPLEEESAVPLNFVANIRSAAVAARHGSPTMSGINGFVEIDYDFGLQQLSGLAEVESEEFRIHLPKLFNDSWEYDYVNGGLRFSLDHSQGQELTLVSNIIHAQSEAATGQVQFSTVISKQPDQEQQAELSLLVGLEQADLEQMSLYLPTGPNVKENLKTTMQWLEQAVLSGQGSDSGVIFRGSAISGSAPITKTFQSFYQAKNARFQFSPDWPELSQVAAAVVTDDNNIDVLADSGESLGIRIDQASAEVRKDQHNTTWLDINGLLQGHTPDAFNYLVQAPLDQGLKDNLATWITSGEFDGSVSVNMPMGTGAEPPHVVVAATVQNTAIEIPEFALQFSQLEGPVQFDTETGLDSRGISGTLFDRPVDIQLSSQLLEGEYTATNVLASGSVAVPDLMVWPRQSQVVRNLLTQAQGEIDYVANLSIESNDDGVTNHLQLDSDLIGASLSLPEPFAKTVDRELPLYLSMNFDGESQQVSGSLGDDLDYQLTVQGGRVDGFILAGPETTLEDAQPMAQDPGIAVVGYVDYLNLAQWFGFIDAMSGPQESNGEMGQQIEFVDLEIGQLDFFDQLLPDVLAHIDSAENGQGWDVSVLGDAVSGDIYIPFDGSQYLDVNLDYLYLPGAGDDSAQGNDQANTPDSASSIQPADVLAQVDPRQLPPMRVKANDLRLGDSDFGRWQLTIDPVLEGIEINDLAFQFRGIHGGQLAPLPASARAEPAPAEEPDSASTTVAVNPAQVYPPLRLVWQYDGNEHRSYLGGELRTDNLADVLTANGFAPSLESSSAVFQTAIDWPGTPALFNALALSGEVEFDIRNGRFLQESGGNNALKLISVLNFDALMRRFRFSDDLLRRGLAYDEINGELLMTHGLIEIQDQLIISGPSSLYQISGLIDLPNESINAEMYLTLPVSDNIPWIGLLTGQLPIAVGAFLFDQIFGDQVDSLTSAVYTLKGQLEGVEPEFKQAFGAPPESSVQEVVTEIAPALP